MPITTTEKAHGAAILRLLENLGASLPGKYFSIETGQSHSAYLLTGFDPKTSLLVQTGIFLKISNSRRTPWRYSFQRLHQEELLIFKNKCGEAFTVFANGDDGFACVNFSSLKTILDHNHEDVEWVSVSRKPNSAYRIAGNDGELDHPVPMNSFPILIVEYFALAFEKENGNINQQTFSFKELVNLGLEHYHNNNSN
jgi:hypothetical protein